MATPYDEEPVLSWGSKDSPRPPIEPALAGREIADGLTPDLSVDAAVSVRRRNSTRNEQIDSLRRVLILHVSREWGFQYLMM